METVVCEMVEMPVLEESMATFQLSYLEMPVLEESMATFQLSY